MSPFTSTKIKLLSFLLIINVLYIHSGFHQEEIIGMKLNYFVQQLLSNYIGRLAVPLFFCFSGYLFFLNTNNQMATIRKKINSRIHSLIPPYLYGCIFFVVVLYLITILPGSEKYFNVGIADFFNKTGLSLIKNVFWMVDQGSSPMAFQLWFLRDLIVVVGISPLLFYIFKYMNYWGFLLLFLLSFIPFNQYFTLNSAVPTTLFTSLLWFALGGVLAVNNSKLVFNKRSIGIVIFLTYLCLSICEEIVGGTFFGAIYPLIILLGISSIWLTYDILVKNGFSVSNYKWLETACSFTFFIYLFHEPTLNIVRKIVVAILGKNEFGYLISYLISPLLFVLIAVLIGLVFRKKATKIYSNLVGGRV
ncbi:MAG: hypothetical protein RL308_356 [Bacteroidota bacterium]|jgi:surface polysaccharide O-acyltransferase-like enzyme